MKTKRLSLSEMWQLYRLLGDGFGKEYLWDEIIEMMYLVPPKNIKMAMGLMYDNVSINPLEIGLMFVKGLQHNKFFEFRMFVEALNGSK